MNTGLEISSCCAKTNSLKLVHENIWTSCRFNVRIKLQQTYGGDQRLKELIGMRIQTFQEELRETVLPFMFLSFFGGGVFVSLFRFVYFVFSLIRCAQVNCCLSSVVTIRTSPV